MQKAPDTLYLIPGEDIDGQIGYLWCDDPAPSHDHNPEEAIKYIRNDRLREMLFSGWFGCSGKNCVVTGRNSEARMTHECQCLKEASLGQLNTLQSRLEELLAENSAGGE